jgi:SnoaL-like domain
VRTTRWTGKTPTRGTQTYTVDGELCSALGNPKDTRRCSSGSPGIVDGDGDSATMRSSYVVIGTNDAPPTILVTGGYEDELVRVDGRWRFACRVHTLDPSYGVVHEPPPK